MTFVYSILFANTAMPVWRWGFSEHEQVYVVLELRLPLPEIIILTLPAYHKVRSR